MTTLPAGWMPIPASLYELILTGDLESLLWKLKGVHEAEEVRMALYNARQEILATEEYSDCTPPATTQDAITVSLDADPRGISVGVWQGSHCIYNGAHAVPVRAQDDAKAVAWMDPETLDVISAERKASWLAEYGAGGAAKAASYTRALGDVSAPAAGDARALLDHPLLREVLGYIEDAGPADVWGAAQSWMALRDAASQQQEG